MGVPAPSKLNTLLGIPVLLGVGTIPVPHLNDDLHGSIEQIGNGDLSVKDVV